MGEFWRWFDEFQPFSAMFLLLAVFAAASLVAAPFFALRDALDKAVTKRRVSKSSPPQPPQSRARASQSGGERDDGPVYWATGNYDPQRYYSETRGWSPEFRDYVRDAYGDLDTYEANHPD
jgi:hypothetical protein